LEVHKLRSLRVMNRPRGFGSLEEGKCVCMPSRAPDVEDQDHHSDESGSRENNGPRPRVLTIDREFDLPTSRKSQVTRKVLVAHLKSVDTILLVFVLSTDTCLGDPLGTIKRAP
jgi:hypothetical protein